MIDLEQFRRKDGTICVETAFVTINPEAKDYVVPNHPASDAILYLYDIEHIQPIVSRQAAAIALATAKTIMDRNKNR